MIFWVECPFNTKKLLEIEKEIVRDVVRGDKHNLRKSASCKAQISAMCRVNDTDLCMRCDLQIFSGCVCHLEQHAQSPFLFPIVFSVNFISVAAFFHMHKSSS